MTMLQKIRLALRGWNRRRDDAARRRDEQFLSRALTWGNGAGTVERLETGARRTVRIDLDGLQVAWLDDSGAFIRFLDRETGDVIECLGDDADEVARKRAGERYREVPRRSAEGDQEDHRLFLERVEGVMRMRLATALAADEDGREFRRALSFDRRVEHDWYNFKNDRALAAIEDWLDTLDLPPGIR